MTKHGHDGTFWISFNDFQKYFACAEICKVVDSYRYSHLRLHQDFNSYSLLKMTVPEPGEYTFAAAQKSGRMHSRKCDYHYSACRLMLVKLHNGEDLRGGVSYISGRTSTMGRDTYIELQHLEPGQYYFYVEMDWEPTTADRSFCATCYGASYVVIEDEIDAKKSYSGTHDYK